MLYQDAAVEKAEEEEAHSDPLRKQQRALQRSLGSCVTTECAQCHMLHMRTFVVTGSFEGRLHTTLKLHSPYPATPPSPTFQGHISTCHSGTHIQIVSQPLRWSLCARQLLSSI